MQNALLYSKSYRGISNIWYNEWHCISESRKVVFDGFASGVEEGAIIGALCGMFGAGTAAMMTGTEMTIGNVFAARVINAVGDATIGTATYIYHENKYDKAITGGDVAKTWAECAITSFVLQSVFGGGKTRTQSTNKNGSSSNSKIPVEIKSGVNEKSSSVNNSDVKPKPYTNSRPSFRKGVVEKVWEKAKGPDGRVRDPNTGDIINWKPGESRKGVWDMGHIPEAKYSEMHEAYMNGELTVKEFVDWYNDIDNYRPELPSNNRSHKYE